MVAPESGTPTRVPPELALPAVPLPVHVNLETSLRCNLACVMCAPHRTGSTQKKDTLDDQLLARIERDVLGTAAYVALTVAGEPFVDRTWPRYVDLAERTGTGLVIHCNGTVLPRGDDLLRLLRHTRVIEFSIDGARPETFAKIRGRDLLPAILDNIRRAVAARATLPRRHRPRLGITQVLMRDTIDELPMLVDLAADLGVDSLGAVHLTVFEDALDAQSLRHTPARSDAAFAEARRRARARGLLLNLPPDMDGSLHDTPALTDHLRHGLHTLARMGRGWATRMVRVVRNRREMRTWERAVGGKVGCNYLMHRAYVSVGGDVTPCCMPGRPVVGNLHDSDFQAIWNGPVYTAMRRGMLEGRPFDCCAHCSVNRREGYQPSDEATVRPPTQQLDPA